MRFTLVKDLRTDPLMRPLIGGLLLFSLLFLLFDVWHKIEQIGLLPKNVATFLYGNEEEFVEPVTQSSLLEIIHMDTFFAMMILLTLSAVYARLSDSLSRKMIMINLSMVGAIFGIVSLLLAYFFHPLFIYIWLFCFGVWHMIALGMAVESFWRLYRL